MATLLGASVAWVVTDPTAPPTQALANGLALNPPMGWNDWNALLLPALVGLLALILSQTAGKRTRRKVWRRLLGRSR